MKIRTDFVTNSSSTSFIIITSDRFNKDDFFGLIGAEKESPFLPIFDALFSAFQQNMRSPEDYFRRYHTTGRLQSLIESEFSSEVAVRVMEARKQGKSVFMGKLSSDSNLIESFFCTDSFELENDKIYLNALECAW